MLYLGVQKLWQRNKVRQCNCSFGSKSQCHGEFRGLRYRKVFVFLFKIPTLHYRQLLPLVPVHLDSGQNEKWEAWYGEEFISSRRRAFVELFQQRRHNHANLSKEIFGRLR